MAKQGMVFYICLSLSSHPFSKEIFLLTPQKLNMVGNQKRVPPPQQLEQRFPLPDLSAAPQIKIIRIGQTYHFR